MSTGNNQPNSQNRAKIGRKKYSTISPGVTTFKILLCFLSVYLGVAIGYSLIRPYEYQRTDNNLVKSSLSTISQPVMDLFANGKVTHSYDWETISRDDIPSTVAPGYVRSKKSQFRDFNNLQSQLQAEFAPGIVSELAVISPQVSNSWSLVFCIPYKSGSDQIICQKNLLSYTGSIRVLVDGNMEVWGVNQRGAIIPVKVTRYIDIKSEPGLLLI